MMVSRVTCKALVIALFFVVTLRAQAELGRAWAPGHNFSFGDGHKAVVFNGRIYVVVESSYKMSVWSSSNCRDWNLEKMDPPFSLRFSFSLIVFDNRIWLIGGDNLFIRGSSTVFNDVWFSRDGSHWELATDNAAFPARTGHSSVVFDNKMWVIGGVSSTIPTVPPGVWALNDVWWSDNGVDWHEATPHAAFAGRSSHSSTVFLDKIWVIGGGITQHIPGGINDLWSSPDGVNWTRELSSLPFSDTISAGCASYDNKMWIMGRVNSDVWSSENGQDWTSVTLSAAFGPRSGYQCLEFDHKLWLLGGNTKNDVWSTTDGLTWTETDETRFPGGTDVTVLDHKLWAMKPSLTSPQTFSISSSPDGDRWTPVAESTGLPVISGAGFLAFNGRLWFIGGRDNLGPKDDIWCSESGEMWTKVESPSVFSPRNDHVCLSYKEKLWVIGGQNYPEIHTRLKDVWCSENGTTWTTVTDHLPFGSDAYIEGCVWKDQMCVVDGHNRQVWVSDNGATWTLHSNPSDFSYTSYFDLISDNDNLWIIGFFSGWSGPWLGQRKIWWSRDAKTWELLKVDPPLLTSALYFKNSIYMFDENVWHSLETTNCADWQWFR